MGHICGTIFLSQETLKKLGLPSLMKRDGLKNVGKMPIKLPEYCIIATEILPPLYYADK